MQVVITVVLGDLTNNPFVFGAPKNEVFAMDGRLPLSSAALPHLKCMVCNHARMSACMARW